MKQDHSILLIAGIISLLLLAFFFMLQHSGTSILALDTKGILSLDLVAGTDHSATDIFIDVYVMQSSNYQQKQIRRLMKQISDPSSPANPVQKKASRNS